MKALTRDQVRDIDRRAVEQFGMLSLVLMENAGRGCADLLERLEIHGRVVICCGRGNNGGDGYVLGRHLDARGYEVQLLCWDAPEAMSADCRANYEIVRRAGIAIRMGGSAETIDLPAGDWYVDALLGTGVAGAPRPPYDRVILALNEAKGRKLAVDIPSGLDSDTGAAASPTFRADETCTFVAGKLGLQIPSAQPYVGRLHVADIGIPRSLLAAYA